MSRQPGERWGQFAERAANAFGLVLVLVIATFALGSLTALDGWTAVLTVLVACSAAVVGLAGAEARPVVLRGAAVLALVAIGLAALAEIVDDAHLLGASAFILTTLLLVAAVAVLRAVLIETEVGFRTILGAISVYTILGLLFTFLYAALDRVQSDPFFGPGVEVQDGDFLFFSYTTLTTTGYGNLVPADQPGKMFAGFEMLMGQIFLVTLVAGLVSLWRPGSIARRRRSE
ncbi:MAG TPA: ion channel [Solirubrobacterales bacterium]|nr:ion channel [Solirubrobacterales bacterium]